MRPIIPFDDDAPEHWHDEHSDWWPKPSEPTRGPAPRTGGTSAGVRGAEPPESFPIRRIPPDEGASREGRSRAVGSEGAATGGELMAELAGLPLVQRRRRVRRTIRAQDKAGRARLSGPQRLLLLDAWLRSKLPAKDFAGLVGVSQHTLYHWKKLFETEGPAGLADKPKGGQRAAGRSRLPEATKRAIVMMKEAHPEWGQDRLHHMLLRTEGFSASPGAIGRVLAEAGYVVDEPPTRPHPDKQRRFERSRPNELWQSDLFTFVLKREGRRVHLVGYMDDCSRFLVAWGLHASSSGALVREVFEAGIARFGAPREVLTDNGSQYITWRGKSEFTRLCERRGVKQIVSRPRHPQTLGKIERFWQTLWRECLESAIFRGIDEARERIGHFVDHYNFQRPHSGIGGLVPADRYFEASEEVRRTLAARVKANALDLARHGEPRAPFYLTGRIGNAALSLHAEGERVVLVREDGTREEVDLTATGRRALPEEREAKTRERENERDEDGPDDREPPQTSGVPVPRPPQPSSHGLASAAELDEGAAEDEESPVLGHSSPCDPAWTFADDEEPPPGGSALDGILGSLCREWSGNPAPRTTRAAEEGGER